MHVVCSSVQLQPTIVSPTPNIAAETVPSWTDDLKDLAVDLTLFASSATLVLVGVHARSVKRRASGERSADRRSQRVNASDATIASAFIWTNKSDWLIIKKKELAAARYATRAN